MDTNVAVIPSTLPADIEKVREIEHEMFKEPQLRIVTRHLIHAGIYSRTVILPKGSKVTTAMIKPPTTLLIVGDVFVNVGGRTLHFVGCDTIPAGANRKQIYEAAEHTYITMSFRTDAKTIKEAEKEMTDDHELVASNNGVNENVELVTGV